MRFESSIHGLYRVSCTELPMKINILVIFTNLFDMEPMILVENPGC
jgi:hypothetical protein